MNVTVNGKRITIRESYPAGEYWDVFQKWVKQTEFKSGKELFTLLGRFIESWEFPGKPEDPAAWETLDVFAEFEPIRAAINQFVSDRFGAVKNSGTESA